MPTEDTETQEALDTEEAVGMEPLPDLPTDRALQGIITKVDYRIKIYQGKVAYKTDFETKEVLYDDKGKPIPQKEFNIEVSLPEFPMRGGDKSKCRRTWISVGASLGKNAKLTLLLANLGIALNGAVKAKAIIDALVLKNIKLLVAKKKPGSKYQKPILETVQAA